MPSNRIKAALWAINLSTKIASLDEWFLRVAHQMSRAAENGCDILVMPEYACLQWLHFAPPMDETQQVSWLAHKIARDERPYTLTHNSPVSVLLGTFPLAKMYGYTNSAVWSTKGQALACQDKLHLTPSETDPHGWQFVDGRNITPFTYRGHDIAVMICHDNDVPKLGETLAKLHVDVILAPSMCDSKSDGINSHEHIFAQARQRGMDAGAKVYAVGAIGTVAGETCWGGAAIYDAQGHILGEIPVLKESDNQYGPMLVELDDGMRII
jgi:predicted amidohydrolase